MLSFASEYPSQEYLSELVYPKYSIESISFIFITDCILGIRNRQISKRCDYGYDDTIGIFENLFGIGDRNIHPKTRNHDKVFELTTF